MRTAFLLVLVGLILSSCAPTAPSTDACGYRVVAKKTGLGGLASSLDCHALP